jgi:tetratricopeptide (TPR) repeat protein
MRSAHPPCRALLAVAPLVALGSCTAPFEFDRNARAPLLEGYGAVSLTVTTEVPLAQQLFTLGLLQTYAFNDAEAARAYKAALAADPRCAMCAWGVAKAAGPNINNLDRGDLGEARRYLASARGDGARSSARERGLIDALIARYGPEPRPGTKAGPASGPVAMPVAPICSAGSVEKADPLDIVYAERMRALADAYPDDADILVLWAEAVMIATRGDWWDRKTGGPAGDIALVSERLERRLKTQPMHPGLNHFLIHALDSSRQPERALAAADRLGAIAPQSPHLVHMPAHIYVRVGRYSDAVRVNEAAVAAQARENASIRAQGFVPSNDWDGHNRHFLWFAALTEGRGELAVEQSRAIAARAAKGKSASAEFMRGLPLLTLARLERWNDVLAEPAPTGDTGIGTALADYANGLALVRTGAVDAARRRAATLQATLDGPLLRGKTLMGDDPARNVIGILSRHLDGEIGVASGRADLARDTVTAGADLEAALNANEPPLLGSISRVALGDLMRRAGRWADAEQAYRAELSTQPGNGWALAGLVHALERQGKGDEAKRIREESERAWANADPAVKTLAAR